MIQHDADIDDLEAEEVATALVTAVENGAALKDLHGVPQGLMDGIHAFAYKFYQQGRLDEAEVFFRFLCIYDFYNAEYAMGLAAIYQLKKQYDRAIDLYGLAFFLAKDDCRPMFHVGQCQLLKGDQQLARRAFAVVAESSTDARLRQKAEVYLSGLGGDVDSPSTSAGIEK